MKNLLKLLFVSLSLLFFSTGCSDDNSQLTDNQNLISSCQCTSYLTANEGVPSFASVEDFRDAYNCLSECRDNLLDEIENQYPNISSEGYDSLVEQGIINEWAAVDAFSNYGGYTSLLRKDLEIEDAWLVNGAIIAEAPEEVIVDEVLKAMIDENCNVKINGQVINICENLVVDKTLQWCTPIGWHHDEFETTDGKHRIKLTGSLIYINILGIGSMVTGSIVAYKKKNGSWKRNRENLTIGATCSVRRSPLNDCEFLTFVPTGSKSKKAESYSSSKVNWLNLQIWYKDPFDPMNPNPDGLVTGNSDHLSAIIGF
jgi:hypothetical protein